MEKKKSHFSKILLLILVIVIVIVGINSTNTNKKHAGDASSPTTLDIGVISIMTGQFGNLGENYVKGIKLAEADYEKAHPNTQINLIVEDDAFDTKKGLAAFQKLTSLNHIDGLINLSTPTINAVHNEITAQNLPTTQFGIQVEGVAKDPIFQISPMAEVPIQKLGEYLKTRTDFKKVAVVYENGAVFEQFFGAFIKGYGEEKTTQIKITSTAMIQDIATKITREDYDAVVILGLPESGALLVKKVATLTKKLPAFVIDAQLQTGYEDYKRILGDLNLLNDGYSIWLVSGNNPAFTSGYEAMYGTKPALFSDYGYDAFKALMDNYDADRNVWIANMQKAKFDGASGKVGFDDLGVRKQDFEIKRIKNGEIVTETIVEMK